LTISSTQAVVKNYGLRARTELLVSWLGESADGLPITITAGSSDLPAEGLTVSLYRLASESRPRDASAALVLVVDYLIEVDTKDPFRAHEILGNIAFQAVSDSTIELLSTEPAENSKRHSLILRVRLQRARSVVKPKPVRQPLTIVLGPVAALEGVVLGPDDVPLVGAELRIPALNLSTLSGPKGRFRFAGLPDGLASITIEVQAKGVNLELIATPTQMLTVRVPLEF
jgi:hypothetical protein